MCLLILKCGFLSKEKEMKKQYSTPTLTTHGDMLALTQVRVNDGSGPIFPFPS